MSTALLALVLTAAAPPSGRAPDVSCAASAEPIDEVTLSRGACFGRCPIYRATFHKDGGIDYIGERNVKLSGAHRARIAPERFAVLAHAVDASGFFCMDANYEKPITDLPDVVVAAKRAGVAHTVRDYADSAPAKLAELEALLDALLLEAKLDDSPLARRYVDGAKVTYAMTRTYEERGHKNAIAVTADGVVHVDGIGVEELAWRDLVKDGVPVALPPDAAALRERVSLDPAARVELPDLRRAGPLTAAMLDLFSFYADDTLAIRTASIRKAGDHAYVEHGLPNSWADGTRVTLGADAIDFDVTWASVKDGVAHVVIKHVPPRAQKLALPAAWMNEPLVAGTANNWVQVTHDGDHYLAGVGVETFEDDIDVRLADGAIVAATMDNPVDVVERVCADARLTSCAAPERYRIHRHIEMRAR